MSKAIQSYVYAPDGHQYFVSTIERECSAVEAHGMRGNETMVWRMNNSGTTPEELVYQTESASGDMSVHFNVCQHIAAHYYPDLVHCKCPECDVPMISDSRQTWCPECGLNERETEGLET